MQIAVHAQNFIENHIASDVPAHLEDLFDHDEATCTGRLVAAAVMLLSTNLVVFAARILFF